MTQPDSSFDPSLILSGRALNWAREIQSKTQQSELTLTELAALIQLVINEERTDVLLKIEQALMKEM